MRKEFLETGEVVGTHGIKGFVRIKPWADDGFFEKLKRVFIGNEKTEIKVLSAKAHGNVIIANLEGIDSIEKAESLRNKTVYVKRDDVSPPENKYFISEIIGADVYDADTNEFLGKLCDVSSTGANDVWHIKSCSKEYLIPAIPQVIVSVDIFNDKIVIRPIKGIFDDEN